MEYSKLPMIPIPASIRRRLPRLYTTHKTVTDPTSSGALCNEMSSSSEPHLVLSQPSKAVEAQRPSTASDDLDSFDSGSGGSNSPQPDRIDTPAKYETESGLRWNRVVPGERIETTQQPVTLTDNLSRSF